LDAVALFADDGFVAGFDEIDDDGFHAGAAGAADGEGEFVGGAEDGLELLPRVT
jgi:hypothetical protein